MRTLRLMAFFVVALSALAASNTRTIETIAGDGKPGFSATELNWLLGLTIGPDGALYFSDSGNHVIRRLDLKTHVLTIVAGNGKDGYDGDGGPATDATLSQPYEVQLDKAGNLFIADTTNNVVRKVDAKTRIISTIAGVAGKGAYGGDGGPALKAQFNYLTGITLAKDGSLLICDTRNNRIRRLDLKTGMVNTFAGTGEAGPTPDGAPLQGTPLDQPRTMTVSPSGDVYVALPTAIYRIDMHTNRFIHIAGRGGKAGVVGDGPGEVMPPESGDAKQATLSQPKGLALSPDVNYLYVMNTETHRILRVNLKTSAIETIAGTGLRGDDRSGIGHHPGVATSPDGDALKCNLSRPHAIAVAKDGTIYFTDSFSNRVRVLR